ncbi:type II toxin-antitoxin system prevent-host-death family antitoxin [Kribbella sp. NPDC056861]|uniref:type II toxin-antitoxin system Phd/YefM family antitoxin n=1 Tax=Kribbella sp. NPDC056861 TaxID=3154857 RepID=UPI003446AC77
MVEIPVRVLNQETAKVLARVKQGEEIEITERGAVIARLIPATPSPVARLLETGKLRLPRTTGPLPHPRGAVRTDQQAGELLEEMRDEERY